LGPRIVPRGSCLSGHASLGCAPRPCLLGRAPVGPHPLWGRAVLGRAQFLVTPLFKGSCQIVRPRRFRYGRATSGSRHCGRATETMPFRTCRIRPRLCWVAPLRSSLSGHASRAAPIQGHVSRKATLRRARASLAHLLQQSFMHPSGHASLWIEHDSMSFANGMRLSRVALLFPVEHRPAQFMGIPVSRFAVWGSATSFRPVPSSQRLRHRCNGNGNLLGKLDPWFKKE